MHKTAIKSFAIWARNKLIADISYKAGLLGITEKEIKTPLPQSTKDAQFFDIGSREPYRITGAAIAQRKALADKITERAKQSDYATAYKAVIEEVAYTWFNRLIAVRFMEVNDYLPSRIRVLSSEPIRDEQGNFVKSGKTEPDIVTTPFDTDLEFTQAEQEYIIACKNDNKLDELYGMLFIKQCNALNALLPELFERIGDYTELLLNISFTDKEGVVWHLVNDVVEADFKEAVEIIGWLYQFYISERHAQVVDPIYSRTVSKEDIPAATQIFTPDWIVRYMVENSLGRLFANKHPELKSKWLYYIETEHTETEVKIEDVRIIDPCMGSGHILVYAFDVLMQIYTSAGYSERDAARLILENNIYGLEIDRRAYQLAYFALMMKARQYNRRILTLGVYPQVYEPTGCADCMEYGSLVRVDSLEPMPVPTKESQMTLFGGRHTEKLNAWNFRRLLTQKYDVVVTNPPYLNNISGKLKDYIQMEFGDYSADLFSVFVYRNLLLCKSEGYSAYMTPNVWMFIKSYEKLRNYIVHNKSIASLVQLAKGAFFKEATVDICTFVLKNSKTDSVGDYVRLEKCKGDMELQRIKTLEAVKEPNCGYRYKSDSGKFSRIAGSPLAYWVGDMLLNAFVNAKTISEIAPPRVGLQTGSNDLFMRNWHEVTFGKIGFNMTSREEAIKSHQKWFPYNKGGAYRRWYGNRDFVVDWEDDGYLIRNNKDKNGKLRSRPQNTQYYFKPAITWSDLTSGSFSGRYCEGGFIFDVKGSSGFPKSEEHYYVLGFLNSKISQECIHILNPTITTQVGDMARIPVFFDKEKTAAIDSLVTDNISLSRADWDSFETSWDFKRHPLVVWREYGAKHHPDEHGNKIGEAYLSWMAQTTRQFETLKKNEEELNRIFIDIYGLQDELTPEVADKDVTVARIYDGKEDIPESMKGNGYVLTRADVIKSFVSYAVGCMFGRYSLDVEGLVCAGGEWDAGKYSTFIPDRDNILPITDEEYLSDDIVSRFVDFVRTVYGAGTLEDNLRFIADALGSKGSTAREVIRSYFLRDFFKDHVKTYKKRPIYWLFDSAGSSGGGKADGFKALVYLHRYDQDTIGRLRVDYLHKLQRVYENEIARMRETIEKSGDAREVAAAQKRLEKLIKQLKEAKEYDEKIAHLALARIALDLDDGVKVNYEKLQTGTDGKKYEVLGKI